MNMKMNPRKIATLLLPALVMAMLLAGCKAEEFYFQEPAKDISGNWRIIKATRNGVDITSRVGDAFGITFGENGTTYQLDDQSIPFIVAGNGTWAFDDPAYPFAISFKPANGSEEITVPFLYQVSEGRRQIQFSFSPCCSTNVYEYLL